MDETTALLVWIILLPFAGAMVAFILGPRKAPVVTIITSCGIIFVVTALAWQVWTYGPRSHAVGGWRAPLGITLYADGLTVLMLIMSVVVGTLISVYALGYFTDSSISAKTGKSKHKSKSSFFWVLWLFLWAALHALFLSRDIFNIYISLELLTLAAVALITLDNGSEALTAAIRYLLTSLFGAALFLLGVAILYANFGTLDLNGLSMLMPTGSLSLVAIAMITIGLLLKTALFPMHFWLPPAHCNALTPVSALLSALVIKGSFYVLLRLWFQIFPVDITLVAGSLIGGLAAAAILWGSIAAMCQKRLKILVAYSTVAQVGYLFLLFPLAAKETHGLGAWNGAIYQAVSHACAKAAMFMVAGNIIRAIGHDRIKDMNGVFQQLPISMFAFALAGLTIMGMPPSGGFAAKWMLITTAIQSGQWWWAGILVTGGLLAAGYIFSVLKYAFIKTKIVNVQLCPVPRCMEWTPLILSIIALFIGFTSMPLDLLRIGNTYPDAVAMEIVK